VMDNPPLREAYNASLPKVTQFWTELGQNEKLFEKYRALKASPGFTQFPAARRKLVENALRDFRLGGAELPAEKKARFAKIQEELARSGSRFSENLLDATKAFGIVVDETRTGGIPPDVLDAAFRLPEGAVSDPVSTDAGTAVFKVVEKHESSPQDLTANKETFREELLNDRKNRFFSSYMQKAKQKMKIAVYRDVVQKTIG